MTERVTRLMSQFILIIINKRIDRRKFSIYDFLRIVRADIRLRSFLSGSIFPDHCFFFAISAPNAYIYFTAIALRNPCFCYIRYLERWQWYLNASRSIASKTHPWRRRVPPRVPSIWVSNRNHCRWSLLRAFCLFWDLLSPMTMIFRHLLLASSGLSNIFFYNAYCLKIAFHIHHFTSSFLPIL